MGTFPLTVAAREAGSLPAAEPWPFARGEAVCLPPSGGWALAAGGAGAAAGPGIRVGLGRPLRSCRFCWNWLLICSRRETDMAAVAVEEEGVPPSYRFPADVKVGRAYARRDIGRCKAARSDNGRSRRPRMTHGFTAPVSKPSAPFVARSDSKLTREAEFVFRSADERLGLRGIHPEEPLTIAKAAPTVALL